MYLLVSYMSIELIVSLCLCVCVCVCVSFSSLQAAVMSAVIASKGSIAVASSLNGLSGVGKCAYSCAKAALHPLVMDTAVHYGKQGVNCNALALGTIQTKVWDFAPDHILPKIAARNPRGAVGTPDEAARALCWLASPSAALINGQVIVADGGWAVACGTVAAEDGKAWWDT